MGATLKAHVDANYADASHSFEQFEIKNDSSFVVNARVAIADITTRDGGPLLEVALWSRNLLDETYVYRRDPVEPRHAGRLRQLQQPAHLRHRAARLLLRGSSRTTTGPLPPRREGVFLRLREAFATAR